MDISEILKKRDPNNKYDLESLKKSLTEKGRPDAAEFLDFLQSEKILQAYAKVEKPKSNK